MLRVYQLMRRQTPNFRSQGLDRLAALEGQGKLEAYLRKK
jgi:hypothetical protein